MYSSFSVLSTSLHHPSRATGVNGSRCLAMSTHLQPQAGVRTGQMPEVGTNSIDLTFANQRTTFEHVQLRSLAHVGFPRIHAGRALAAAGLAPIHASAGVLVTRWKTFKRSPSVYSRLSSPTSSTCPRVPEWSESAPSLSQPRSRLRPAPSRRPSHALVLAPLLVASSPLYVKLVFQL